MFWYNNDSLFKKYDYDNILAHQRVNHHKFQDMEGPLKHEDILNKLEDDFDKLCQLKHIRKSLPPISFSKCMELKVIAREM
jgi:3-methyladenine DNA glycosylase/8-oxoguanine DNA glycosylase